MTCAMCNQPATKRISWYNPSGLYTKELCSPCCDEIWQQLSQNLSMQDAYMTHLIEDLPPDDR